MEDISLTDYEPDVINVEYAKEQKKKQNNIFAQSHRHMGDNVDKWVEKHNRCDFPPYRPQGSGGQPCVILTKWPQT